MGTAALADRHRAYLEARAVSEEVAAERSYRSVTRRRELADLGFADYQCLVPALVLPVHDVHGRVVNYQCRPDVPRVDRERGREVKFETVADSRMVLDVPPRCRERLRDPREDLWITEGPPKGDALASAGACAVALLGVWCFKGTNARGGKTTLVDFDSITLNAGRRILICFDSDAVTKRGVHAAMERLGAFLRSKGADVRFVYIPAAEGEKVGADDFLAGGGTLAELVALATSELRPPPPEPTPERRPALPTAALLGSVEGLLRRFVRFPSEHGIPTLALYVLHTWALEACRATPYMLVISPEKQSGKTRTLEVVELLVREPLRASNITAAAIFQSVEAWCPTLLLDELDTIFVSKGEAAEALRAVLNSGNRRGACAVRGTQDGTPARFGTFCPKVLSGINTGKLPDTIRDRAIVLRIERLRRGERVEDLFPVELEQVLEELRGRLEDWAAEHAERLAAWRRSERIPELSDRLQEAWDPLLAIAALAGGDWPKRAREAAVGLVGGAADIGEDAHGHLLLRALRCLFGGEAGPTSSTPTREILTTKTICERLNDDDELPFAGYRDGVGINARGVAALLRAYGIKPRTVRIGDDTPKGYHREQFTEAWSRYVGEAPEDTPAEEGPSDAATSATPPQPAPEAGSDVADGPAQNATSAQNATYPPHVIPLKERDVADVADVADFQRPPPRVPVSASSGNGAAPAVALEPEPEPGVWPTIDPPCRWPAHRPTDYALRGAAMWTCGVCHPVREPMLRYGIVRRSGGRP